MFKHVSLWRRITFSLYDSRMYIYITQCFSEYESAGNRTAHFLHEAFYLSARNGASTRRAQSRNCFTLITYV